VGREELYSGIPMCTKRNEVYCSCSCSYRIETERRSSLKAVDVLPCDQPGVILHCFHALSNRSSADIHT